MGRAERERADGRMSFSRQSICGATVLNAEMTAIANELKAAELRHDVGTTMLDLAAMPDWQRPLQWLAAASQRAKDQTQSSLMKLWQGAPEAAPQS